MVWLWELAVFCASVVYCMTVISYTGSEMLPIYFWLWKRLPLKVETRAKIIIKTMHVRLVSRRLLLELRPFALAAMPIIIIDYNLTTTDGVGWRLWRNIIWLIWVWIIWSNKDDRWKKRRKKTLEQVKEVAGKLVVVPVPAPAGS